MKTAGGIFADGKAAIHNCETSSHAASNYGVSMTYGSGSDNLFGVNEHTMTTAEGDKTRLFTAAVVRGIDDFVCAIVDANNFEFPYNRTLNTRPTCTSLTDFVEVQE